MHTFAHDLIKIYAYLIKPYHFEDFASIESISNNPIIEIHSFTK